LCGFHFFFRIDENPFREFLLESIGQSPWSQRSGLHRHSCRVGLDINVKDRRVITPAVALSAPMSRDHGPMYVLVR
jgi:hypothetical protein